MSKPYYCPSYIEPSLRLCVEKGKHDKVSTCECGAAIESTPVRDFIVNEKMQELVEMFGELEAVKLINRWLNR